jgi:hypothetical protein
MEEPPSIGCRNDRAVSMISRRYHFVDSMRFSIEVDRAPDDVFAYLAELDRHGEWQEDVISARMEPPGAARVGTRNIEVRRVPGGPREVTAEVTEYDPPRRIAARGLGGPIRPRIALSVEPLGVRRCRVIMDVELLGYGMGRLFVIFARRHAGRQVPRDLARLKALLEHAAP